MRKKINVPDDDYKTPEYIHRYLKNKYFGEQEVFDPCPFMSEFDGLSVEWKQNNYINPPYSKVLKDKFILKAYEESKKGKLCVMLIPACTDTRIFHEIIFPNARIEFIKGRICFEDYHGQSTKSGQHSSMFVIFGGNFEKYVECVDIRMENLMENQMVFK